MNFTNVFTRSIFLIIGLCSISTVVQAGPPTYDNFDTRLSPLLWQARFANQPHEIIRETKNGQLNLRLRGLSDTTATGGQRTTRNALLLPASVGGTTKVVQSLLKVNKISVRGCGATNADTSLARFVQFHGLFNDGSSSTPGNFSGDVYANLSIGRGDTDTFKNTSARVEASLDVCRNADCTVSDTLFHIDDPNTTDVDESTDGSMGRVRFGEQLSLRLVLDETAQTIKFRVKKAGKPIKEKLINYSSLVTNAGPFANPGSAVSIQARTAIANCDLSDPTLKAPRGLVDVSVLKVNVADTPDGS